jgi:hypothetical protein
MKKTIKIPKIFHELFGTETTLLDFCLILVAATITTVLVLMYSKDYSLDITKRLLLVILALDIGGGVVSNFTIGTKKYYHSHPKLKDIFIPLHITQPLLLWWIFPTEGIQIFSIALMVLISAYVVLKTSAFSFQKLLSILLTGSIIALIVAIQFTNTVLPLLLGIFAVKLIVGFAIKPQRI